MYFPNFYEWLHSQENFQKWLNGKRWALDKDILIKRNKIYSPDTCCLVPQEVNAIFIKGKRKNDNDLPIGVSYNRYKSSYVAGCNIGHSGRHKTIGYYNTPEEAFYAYKIYKEEYIE